MFRKLLASPSRFHFEHSFSLRLTLVNSACRSRHFPPSRNGTPFFVNLYRAMRFNRMISFRSDSSGSSLRRPRQVVSVSKQRDVSLPSCLHQHKLRFFYPECEVLQRVHHCHQGRRRVFGSIYAVQEDSTHARLLSLATRNSSEVCSTTFLDCELVHLELLVFRHHSAHPH